MRSSSTFPEPSGTRATLLLLRLAAILLCSLSTTSVALDPGRTLAEYVRDSWNLRNGFSGGQVNSFAQTPDGYLWIGTDRGLYRFDGRTFVDARKLDSSLPNPINVVGLATDGGGSLWVRTEGSSLLVYRSGHFENFFVQTERERSITEMSRSPQGDILVSTLVHGKFRVHDGALVPLLPLEPPTSPLVIALAESSYGQVWAGTRDEGVFRITSHGLTSLPGTLPDKKVNVMLPAENGRLWIGTDMGLALWNGSSITTSEVPPALQKAQVLALLRDMDGNLWVGTPHGLLRMGRNNNTASTDKPGEPITALFEDREGNLWVGSSSGIERLRDSPFVIRDLPGVASGFGGPIYVDQQGRAWIAPSAGGLISVLNGQVTHVTAAGIDRDVIYSIDGGPNELWLGRRSGGLTHLRLQNGAVASSKTYTRADGLPQSSIYAVHRSPDGAVWAATVNGGASELRNGKITTFTTDNGLPSNSVNAVEDSSGATWLATSNGLARLTRSPSGLEWQTFTSENGLPSDNIISLFADPAGYLWIGTSSGLALLREGRIQPLPNLPKLREPIFGLAEDRRGSLWIATSTRLLSVNINSLLQGSPGTIGLREYGIADGLPGTETVRRNRSVVSDANGRVWFSLNQGIATAFPSRIFGTTVPALTLIESLTSDGNLIPLSNAARLPASSKRLVFNFAGLSLAFPDRVQYRYRLDGFDRSWSEPTSTRQAVYTNLAPANYRFHVLSSSPNDQWSGQEATYNFSIEPAAWQTWWFQLAMAAALGLLASFIIHWRIRQMTEKLNLRFEERLAERTRIAQELHDTLLQGFLSASMQLHVAADQLPADSPVRTSLDRILTLMHQVNLEGRNTLRGLRSDTVDSTTLEQSFSRVPHDLAPALSSSDNHPAFRVIVQGQPRALHPVTRDEVCRIGREAILNAFLHAQATAVEVELEYTPGGLRLVVRDDGIGIDPEILRSGREGHWGLIGMRERAGSIGGNLKLFSRSGAGTEVELGVPGNIAYQHPTNSLGHRLARLWTRKRQRTSS